MEVLKQPQYEPMPVEEETAIVFAAGQGYLDDVPLEEIKDCEGRLLGFLKSSYAPLLRRISQGSWSRAMEAELREAIEQFKEGV
jgi:F-type H+-transporting ATPase subunit alpha